MRLFEAQATVELVCEKLDLRLTENQLAKLSTRLVQGTRRLRFASEADEITSLLFIEVCEEQKSNTVDFESLVRVVDRVTKRLYRDYQRSSTRIELHDHAHQKETLNPTDETDNLSNTLRELCNILSPSDYLSFHLLFIEGNSIQEVCDTLAIKKTKAYETKKRLQMMLQDHFASRLNKDK